MKDRATTSKIMLDCVIALIPATAFGIYNFGLKALLVILVCICSAFVAELIGGFIFRRGLTVKDFSFLVTGLILSLTLPPDIPLWMPACASGFAVLIIKHIFGGLGKNIFNPAAAARTVMMFVFTGYMTTFMYNGYITPAPLIVATGGGEISLVQMLFGNTAGNIGETSALALIAGAIYLLLRRIIHWRVPAFIIITVAVYMSIYSALARGGFDAEYVLANILGGGLILCACFMATDCVTSPITPWGQFIYAIIVGVALSSFRVFYDNIGAPSFALIIGNALTLLINYITVPRSFGKGAREKAKAMAFEKEQEKIEIAKEQEAFERLKAQIIENQKES